MKRSTLCLISLALAVFFGAGRARGDAGVLVPIRDTRHLFVPVGYDDNDDVVVVLDGYLADPCHRLRPAEVKIDREAKVVTITPMAERYNRVCFDVIVPFHQVVGLGPLPSGDYRVQLHDGSLKERLGVKVAVTPGPDDFLYAPIDSASVSRGPGGKLEAHIRGRFTSTCLALDRVTLVDSGKTFEVLPIVKILSRDPNGAPCRRYEWPFESKIELPALEAGRYLLHVRSLNGQSVNVVF